MRAAWTWGVVIWALGLQHEEPESSGSLAEVAEGARMPNPSKLLVSMAALLYAGSAEGLTIGGGAPADLARAPAPAMTWDGAGTRDLGEPGPSDRREFERERLHQWAVKVPRSPEAARAPRAAVEAAQMSESTLDEAQAEADPRPRGVFARAAAALTRLRKFVGRARKAPRPRDESFQEAALAKELADLDRSGGGIVLRMRASKSVYIHSATVQIVLDAEAERAEFLRAYSARVRTAAAELTPADRAAVANSVGAPVLRSMVYEAFWIARLLGEEGVVAAALEGLYLLGSTEGIVSPLEARAAAAVVLRDVQGVATLVERLQGLGWTGEEAFRALSASGMAASIHAADVATALPKLGLGAYAEYAGAFVTAMDLNASGRVDRYEFLEFWKALESTERRGSFALPTAEEETEAPTPTPEGPESQASVPAERPAGPGPELPPEGFAWGYDTGADA